MSNLSSDPIVFNKKKEPQRKTMKANLKTQESEKVNQVNLIGHPHHMATT
jgi:hypothetical protein